MSACRRLPLALQAGLATTLLAVTAATAGSGPGRESGLAPPPAAPERRPVAGPPASNGVVDVTDFGAVADGATDDTAAIQAAIDSLSDNGGIVFFPEGRYLVLGQIVLPNDGAAQDVRQPPFKFTGAGALFDGRQGAPTGGTILDLRHDGGPKIATYGLGLLELEGITFADYGPSTSAFLYTTNTTLLVHGCGFYGNSPHHAAINDAIVLGGTSTLAGVPDPNAPFQGYGTVIRDNYFARIRRAVYGRVFANGVVVTGNTIWKNCGNPTGAAIELDGDPDNATLQINGGWYVAGNLIEVKFYAYGISARESQRNAFIANNFYDQDTMTIAYYRFEASGRLNFVLAGFHDDAKPLVQDRAVGIDRSTVIDFHQSRDSTFAQPTVFLRDVRLEQPNMVPFGPRLFNFDGDELSYQMSGAGMTLWFTPFGDPSVPLWQVQDLGNGTVVQELKGDDALLRNVNGAVGVQAAAGAKLTLGDATSSGVEIQDGALTLKPTDVRILSGSGPPDVAAPDGSIYLRTDGGTGSTFYVRESGAWLAK